MRTARRHRDRAARFYVKPGYITGALREWIDTGEERDACGRCLDKVDDDVKELAEQFAEAELSAVSVAVCWYEGDASPTFRATRAIQILESQP